MEVLAKLILNFAEGFVSVHEKFFGKCLQGFTTRWSTPAPRKDTGVSEE
jgi:hypothetical protein